MGRKLVLHCSLYWPTFKDAVDTGHIPVSDVTTAVLPLIATVTSQGVVLHATTFYATCVSATAVFCLMLQQDQ